MKKLFVIGNGFDLAHKLPTSYDNFKEYLYNTYNVDESIQFIAPEGSIAPDGELVYDDDHVAGFIIYMISYVEGLKWRDLEYSVGMLEFDELFDGLPVEYDREGDYHDWRNVYIKQDFASNLVEPLTRIKKLFKDWINTISISSRTKPIKNFKLLIDPNDVFLSFNYTETLEVLYGVKDVCHIHGSIHEKIHFGHGDDYNKYDEYQSKYIGAENYLTDIHRSLRKDTDKALEEHIDFFNNLCNDIDKVYSFGFSYSKVDETYISEICKRIDTKNIIWYLNDYDDESTRREYEATIRRCGFKGKIGKFSV